jgi:hypothetical protein
MPIPLLLAAAPAIASSLFGAVKGVQALNQSKKIKPEYYNYGDERLADMASPYAKQMLGMAQTQLNAQDPFAAAQQRGILSGQAGAMSGVQRSAMDPSQALALTAAIQGNTNQAMFQQGLQNQQNYQSRLANLTGAQQTMIGEGDKAYQDRLRKFQIDTEMKQQLQNAGAQTLMNAGASLGSSLLGIRGMQTGGTGFGNMFKKSSNLNFGSLLNSAPTADMQKLGISMSDIMGAKS